MTRQRLVIALLTLVMLALAVAGMTAILLNTRPLTPESVIAPDLK